MNEKIGFRLHMWTRSNPLNWQDISAGFSPEFTGIENAFMNASLMGFSRKQTEDLLPDVIERALNQHSPEGWNYIGEVGQVLIFKK